MSLMKLSVWAMGCLLTVSMIACGGDDCREWEGDQQSLCPAQFPYSCDAAERCFNTQESCERSGECG